MQNVFGSIANALTGKDNPQQPVHRERLQLLPERVSREATQLPVCRPSTRNVKVRAENTGLSVSPVNS